jgi:hypothetical protein
VKVRKGSQLHPVSRIGWNTGIAIANCCANVFLGHDDRVGAARGSGRTGILFKLRKHRTYFPLNPGCCCVVSTGITALNEHATNQPDDDCG